MKTEKWVVSLFAILLLFSMLYVPVNAEETPTFRYELTVDGSDTVEVSTGDIITVTLYLYRTDESAPYSMYAMQDEIRYDSEFFELVEDSVMLSTGIHSTDLDVGGGMREFYMNYVSFSGGAQWQPKTRIGSFQLRVIGTEGVSTITNEDFLVSHQDGMDGYDCEANELTVIVSSECTVKFETNGGSKIDPVKVIFGEKLTELEDPVREGMYFAGWYKDIHLSQKWDFENDTVRGNMTLYAKWTTTEPGSETEAETETETESLTTEPPTTETEATTDSEEPGKDAECPICGNESGKGMCLNCSLRVYLLVLIAILVLLAISIIVYRLIIKKHKQTSTAKDSMRDQMEKTERMEDNSEDSSENNSEDNSKGNQL